jgi:hypothetical protein
MHINDGWDIAVHYTVKTDVVVLLFYTTQRVESPSDYKDFCLELFSLYHIFILLPV